MKNKSIVAIYRDPFSKDVYYNENCHGKKDCPCDNCVERRRDKNGSQKRKRAS